MKVVVTGGSGQLGTLVLWNLIRDRRVREIRAFDVSPPLAVSPKLKWTAGDVRTADLDALCHGAEIVVHLAFIVLRRASRREMYSVNVEGSRRVFEAAARAGARAIVYASSIAAYGVTPGQPEPIVEDTPRQPSGILYYSDNKREVEDQLDAFEAAHPAVRVVRLRPGILIGRRMEHEFGNLLRRRWIVASHATPLPIVWDEDVADVFARAVVDDGVRGAFNLCAEHQLDAAALGRAAGLHVLRVPEVALEAALGARGAAAKLFERRSDPDEAGDLEWLRATRVRLLASSARARAELGWRPRAATAREVIELLCAEVPHRIDPRIVAYLRLMQRSSRRSAGELAADGRQIRLRIHLDIRGPRGGDFVVEVRDGGVTVRRGIVRPPDAVVALSDRALLEIITGRTDLSTAQLTGRVQVWGDPSAGFVLGTLTTAFRAATERPGFEGFAAARLSRWFESGLR